MKTIDLPNAVIQEHQRYMTRRWFFRECGVGLAGLAVSSLLGSRAAAALPRR